MHLVHVLRPAVPSRAARRAVAVLLVGGSLAFGVAGADAHTQVVSTSPKGGSTASPAPRTVSVTFSGQFRPGATLVVRRGRTVVSKGRATRDPRNVLRIQVDLKRGLAAGRYTASYRITAADAHVQRGSFSFRVRR